MNRLPSWFKQDLPNQQLLETRFSLFKSLSLNTVCKSALCPNMGSCFQDGQATFMILGDTCTRNCGFCAVKKGAALAINPDEPCRLVKAVREMQLDYVVITSVSRDDLDDKGAIQFANCVEALRKDNKNLKIELLIPDFQGIRKNLEIVVKSSPDVLAHNLETVPRLYDKVRPQADYNISMQVLDLIKKLNPSIITKSGIMVGLGENFEEVVAVMKDLRRVNCDILTIGQYLAPSKAHIMVQRFLPQEEFDKFQEIALDMGFKCVASAPLVRSSFKAKEIFAECLTR